MAQDTFAIPCTSVYTGFDGFFLKSHHISSNYIALEEQTYNAGVQGMDMEWF